MLDELRPRLWRWTARHPEWREDAAPGSPADWPPDVGSVAYAADDALVVIDPLIPEDRGELWRWLDDLVTGHGKPVVVIITIGFHRRSRDELVRRYGASTSRARGRLPRGVETIPIRGAGETVVWIPEHRALVPGDRLLGDVDGGLRLCPETWLSYLPSRIDHEVLRERLRPLLDLPIDLVLVSHGEPVLANGREAIARAIASPA